MPLQIAEMPVAYLQFLDTRDPILSLRRYSRDLRWAKGKQKIIIYQDYRVNIGIKENTLEKIRNISKEEK